MMKKFPLIFVIIIFFVFIFAFVSCGGGEGTSDTSDGDGLNESGVVFDDETGYIYTFTDGSASVSEDGRLRVESGAGVGNGTMVLFWNIWTVVDDEGEKHSWRMTGSSHVYNVHSIRKSDGSTYYIMTHCCIISSGYEYVYEAAYRIVGDTVKGVNVVDGDVRGYNPDVVGDYDAYQFGVELICPDWLYSLPGNDKEWMIAYDTVAKDLYIPATDCQYPTDRYIVWHFNGNRFVSQGEKPHRNLNEEVCEYFCLLDYMETEDYVVRVDEMDGGAVRYASWRKPKSMADKPDVVIMGEKRGSEEFQFENGEYEYVVKRGRELIVRKGGKEVLRQSS